MPKRRRGDVVVTDPRAMRALAHPARLAVLEALGEGSELTATACAELTGLTPSAMSYHLRALEKWGFVERADSGEDGRERPWRSVGRGFRIDALPDAAAAAAATAVSQVVVDRMNADLNHWIAHESDQPRDWVSVAGIANTQKWLTVEEVRELQALCDDFLAARRDRTAADHPDGARRVRVTRVVIPQRAG